MKNEKEKTLSITYYTKQSVICPVCKKPFPREELLSGLTDELRRTYEPSAKYGTIYPLIYSVAVCSHCDTAMLWNDMTSFNDSKTADVLYNSSHERSEIVKNIFPHYDFKRDRTLLEGCASYYLALLCYEKMPASYSPTIKKAQICLRLAWLCDDMNKLYPEKNYDFVRDTFYKKSLFLYQESLNLEMEHKESITNISSFGPDLDKNYGYDGVIYLSCLLEYKYGQRSDIKARLKKIESCKHSIARIFGLSNVMSSELVEFDDGEGTLGIALNLEEDNVGAVVLGDYTKIKDDKMIIETSKQDKTPMEIARWSVKDVVKYVEDK